MSKSRKSGHYEKTKRQELPGKFTEMTLCSSDSEKEDSPSSRDSPRLPGASCKKKPSRLSPSQTSWDSQSTRKTSCRTRGTLGATPKSEGGLSTDSEEEDSPSSRDTLRLPGTSCKKKPPRQSPSQKSGNSQSTPTRPKTRKTSHRTHDPVLREHSPPLSPLEYSEATPESAIKEEDTCYYYAFILPFVCSDPNYLIIKVGITRTPGTRLYNISTAFDKQISRDDFKCNFGIKKNDSAARTISKAKEDHSKFLFIVACKVSPKDGKPKIGEDKLRGLLGQPITDDFIHKVLESVPHPCRLKSNCGPTEWVICRRRFAENVRRAFKSNKLDGNTDKCWDSWHSLVKEFMNYLPDTKLTFTLEHENGRFQEEHYVLL